MSLQQQLRALGFSDRHVHVYMFLMRNGNCLITHIARGASLHRHQVYRILGELSNRQLISRTQKGKRTYYSAAPLDQFIEHEQQKLRALQAGARAPVNTTHVTASKHMRFLSFDGALGLRAAYEHILNACEKGSIFYRYESPHDYKKQDTYLPPKYLERVCAQREIQKFVITNPQTASRKDPQMERSVRTLRSEKITPFNRTQIIYPGGVAYIDFDHEQAWIIEDPLLAQFQKELFLALFYKL